VKEFLTKEISTKLTDIIPLFLFSFMSPHTRRAYKNDLQSFCQFLSTQDSTIYTLMSITDIHIAEWKTLLEQKLNLDPTSVRRKLNCVSALFEFARKRKYIDTNPVKLIKKPTQKNISKTNALTEEEIKRLFFNIKTKIQNTIRDKETNKYYKRKLQSLELQYAVLHLLCGSGIRVGELCQLKLGDLEVQTNLKEFNSYILHIRKTKGNSEHKIFLNSSIANHILSYKKKYRKNDSSEQPFFIRSQLSTRNIITPLSPRTVYEFVRNNAIEAGIQKKISPHSIRAGVATLLHATGVPIARIQKQLGHKDIATTSIYIKKSNEIEESAALKLQLNED